MPRPPVTIITPVRNQARYLPDCLRSVREQGVDGLEHIVLDGGSTDGTVEVLRAAGDAITWRSGRDGGQAAAINEGLRRARGDVIAWLNGDDVYAPGAVARALAVLRERPEVGIVHGRGDFVDEDGRFRRAYPAVDAGRRELARRSFLCQPTVFLRRSVVEDVGPLAEHLELCFDYDWWLRILDRHRAAFIDATLAHVREHAGAKTTARRLRGLVEAGYLMRLHFGRASWRWSAKWVLHRHRLDRRRFAVPGPGWARACASAVRYRRRFDARRRASVYGTRLLERCAAAQARSSSSAASSSSSASSAS